MSFTPKRVQQRDKNEPEIVACLRAVGCSIIYGQDVDIIAGREGVNYLMEIKPEAGPRGGTSHRNLNEKQQILHRGWKGRIAVVRTAAEALDHLGITGENLRRVGLAAAEVVRQKRLAKKGMR